MSERDAPSGEDESPIPQVRRKAERMDRARRQPPSLFRMLIHVGVLGWLFILPLVGFTMAAHAVGRALGRPGLGLIGLLVGLLVGVYLVWRSVHGSLGTSERDPQEERNRGER